MAGAKKASPKRRTTTSAKTSATPRKGIAASSSLTAAPMKASSGSVKPTANKSPTKRKKPASTPRKSAPTPTRSIVTADKPPPTPTPRKRMRASEFAGRKSSSRKRRRSRGAPESTDGDARGEEEVDQMLRGVRKLVEAGAGGGLGQAVAEARRAFEEGTDGSLSDGGSAGGEKVGGDGSFVTPKKGRKSDVEVSAKMGSAVKGKKSGKKSKKVSKTASAHKADIEALKQDDPEFYKFLEENDTALIDFSDSDLQENEGEEMDATAEAEREEADESEDESAVDEDDGVASGDESPASSDDSSVREGPAVENENDKKREAEVSQDEDLEQAKVDAHGGNAKSSNGSTVDAAMSTAVENESGYSDEDGSENASDEDMEEAEAAAEAGLDRGETNVDVNSDDDDDDESLDDDAEEADAGEIVEAEEQATKKKLVIVDLAYLRNIKEQLKSSRSCLKAAKDLLRLFRAGRDILPEQSASLSKESKLNKKKVRKAGQKDSFSAKELGEMEEDEFVDDGSFTSGKVKFVSAKAYQLAMNLSIVGLQDALDRMLGRPELKKSSSDAQLAKWDPTESNRWMNLQPVFRSYVFHMIALCDSTVDPDTVRFLLKRLERFVPYTKENKILLKKILRLAIKIWSSDALLVSEASRLRAYLLLSKLALGEGNAEIVLRSCCSIYASKISAVCNPRTLPRIHFAMMCIVELFGIDMGASYTTAFANLREMAVSLRAVSISKDEKGEVERIHNWSFINQLRLWSKILGRYGAEDELHPLIYPYVQIALGVMRLHATPRTYPLRLHVASYLSDLVAETGTFIPLPPHLLNLLRCSELRKKPSQGSTKALEWRSILRVSSDAIKTKPFLTGIVDGIVVQLAKFFAIISKHVSFPELAHVAEEVLRKFAKEVMVSEWKTRILALAEKLKQTADIIMNARSRADFSPHGAASADGMLAVVPGLDPQRKMPIERFYEVEQARVAKTEKLRDEKTVAPQEAVTDAENTSADDSGTDVEVVPVPKRKVGKKKQAEKPKLSIAVALDDDDEDVVEDLELDSEDSSEGE